MESPAVEYRLPTSRAFAGMKRILFQPFDIGKWFVLGFTAWLAGLVDGGSSGGGGGGGGDGTDNSPEEGGSESAPDFFADAGEWAKENLELAIGIGAVLVLILVAVVIALLWVSSRGKFMFLDNVAHNRARIKIPWNEFRAQGDSLFRWRLVFGGIVLLVLLLIGGGTAAFVYFEVQTGPWTTSATLVTILLGVVFTAVILVIGYIGILLEDFVIPLMYGHSLATNDAWRRFLAIHRTAPGSFVFYALWKTLLMLGAIIGIVLVGFATCCIGFLIMVIPYIGAVALLPVSVFFRLLGPEFLRQFGSDGAVLPLIADAAEGLA